MLSKYQLLIADFYNISISNVKKLVPNIFDKEKYVFYYENLQLYLRLELRLNQPQWLNPHFEFNTKKRTEAEKNEDKGGKALYKLINNAIYEKTMEILRNRNNVKLGHNQKILFKIYIKTKLFVAQNILK